MPGAAHLGSRSLRPGHAAHPPPPSGSASSRDARTRRTTRPGWCARARRCTAGTPRPRSPPTTGRPSPSARRGRWCRRDEADARPSAPDTRVPVTDHRRTQTLGPTGLRPRSRRTRTTSMSSVHHQQRRTPTARRAAPRPRSAAGPSATPGESNPRPTHYEADAPQTPTLYQRCPRTCQHWKCGPTSMNRASDPTRDSTAASPPRLARWHGRRACATGSGHRGALQVGEVDPLQARAWVAASNTGGATPARCACAHRLAHKHQRSPGRNPGKPNSGRGVTRSLPTPTLNRRNSSVTTAQTVCTPASSASVSQQPSRRNPVIGSVPQLSSSPPSTFLATSRW